MNLSKINWKIYNVPSKNNFSFSILCVLYMVGIFGISSPYSSNFVSLSALNLLITFILIIWNEYTLNIKYIFYVLIISILGYVIEVVGVHTGFIFGAYYYGSNLGIKWLQVPLVIGINWFILVAASAAWVRYIGINHRMAASVVAAFLMVMLDVFIEPVATKLDFWHWKSTYVPIQNYIGWFFTALLLQYIYFPIIVKDRNHTIALLVWCLQSIFFIILYFYL